MSKFLKENPPSHTPPPPKKKKTQKEKCKLYTRKQNLCIEKAWGKEME